MPEIFKIRFPKSNHETYRKLIESLAGLDDAKDGSTSLDSREIARVVGPDMFNNLRTNAEIDKNADILTQILGKHLTSNWQHGIIPRKTR